MKTTDLFPAVVGLSTDVLKERFAGRSMERRLEEAKKTVEFLETLKSNIDNDLSGLMVNVNYICKKFGIVCAVRNPHGPGKFVLEFQSDKNEELYDSLKKLASFINSTKSMRVYVAGGHGYDGSEVEFFSFGPFYVIYVG